MEARAKQSVLAIRPGGEGWFVEEVLVIRSSSGKDLLVFEKWSQVLISGIDHDESYLECQTVLKASPRSDIVAAG